MVIAVFEKGRTLKDAHERETDAAAHLVLSVCLARFRERRIRNVNGYARAEQTMERTIPPTRNGFTMYQLWPNRRR